MAPSRKCRLQNQIIARLQGQVQMRHQARFGGNRQHQVFIRLYAVDAADP
jgi:hypothetical protein